MKVRITILLLLGIIQQQLAQEHFGCATDLLHHNLYNYHPGIKQKVIENYNFLEQFTQDYNPQNKGAIAYTIPVVFHVIHNYGEENVSKAQILDGLRILNEGFQKRNPDTANLIAPFKQIAADCEIEFKLAQIDPNGNCTTGITRHVDSSTYSGLHHVKDIVHWDPSKYLNIYICNQAAGLAGHALVPPAADTIPQWDGIVLQHSYLGSIGTSNLTRSVVLTHEVGHYFNLQHTWGGNNVPNFPYLPVGDANNCNYDDGVTDTPNTIGNQTQNLNATSCGSLDNVQNFMEYSYLNSMFTEGQKTRMHAALNSPIANRNNLWTTANLNDVGVNGVNSLCSVDFEADKYTLCAGDSILLTDVSLHGVTLRSWQLNGANVSTSSDSLFYAVFNTPGIYDISLTVNNGNQSGTVVKQIEVFGSPADRTALLEGFEWETSLDSSHWIVRDTNDSWHIADYVGHNSQRSLVLTNFDDFSGRKTVIDSKPIDVSFANALTLSFDYAFAKKTSSSADRLWVKVSNNCGKTWLTRKLLSAASSLTTVSDTVATSFIPNNNEWNNMVITNIPSSYFVDNLMVRFEFKGGGGNNIYLDNINLYDPAYSSISEKLPLKISLYPNPAKESITIDLSKTIETNGIEIYDLYGRLLKKVSFSGTSVNISVSELPQGTYLFKIGEIYKKVTVVK